MGSGFAYWSIFLQLVLLVMCINHGNGGGISMLQNVDEKEDPKLIHGQALLSSSSHMMDPSQLIFFTLKDLKLGKTMPIYFPNRDPSKSPHFLPRHKADTIPFSSKQIFDILRIFSFSQNSPQAKAMEDTLQLCESEPIIGETKFCATSLETMLDFTRDIFGSNSQFRILTTTHFTKSKSHKALFQNYTITEVPVQIVARKMVACHRMPYPYAVFYCHNQLSENRVFKVWLGGENGDKVDALAVCHMDTSHWPRDHVSFRVLGIESGMSPVCHFFPADHFVWIPIPSDSK